MPPTLTPHLRELLVEQDNVVALWQLPTSERRAVIRAAKRGHWRRLSHAVYLGAPGEPSADQRVWAAGLHGGKHARLSGRTALILHGWSQTLRKRHDVVVPHHVHPKDPPEWVRIHRLVQPVTGPAAQPLRTSPHVATLHASAWASSDREAMLTVISVLQQRLTSPARLASTLTSMPRLHRHRLIGEMVREYADGAHSLNEFDFAALCRRHFVPEPIRQSRVYDNDGILRAIDARFQTRSGRELRVEIEGLHHLDPEHYLADVDRHNALALSDPATTLRITTWHLRQDPAPFMTDLGWAILHS
jgi:hypothetical protein